MLRAPAKATPCPDDRRGKLKLSIDRLARSTRQTAQLGLLALAPALALAQNTPVPASLSAQERLEAIRLGLVEASLQSPTKVQSTTWIDSRGGLHELSVFKNTMQLQGVRVLGFSRDADGQAKAQLQLPQAQAQTGLRPAQESAAKASGQTIAQRTRPTSLQLQEQPCATPVFNDRLRHTIQFSLRMDADTHPVLGQRVPGLVREHWIATSQPGQVWQLVPDLAKPLVNQDITAYERALLGNAAENQPWQAKLEISSQLREVSGQASKWNPWHQPALQLLLHMVLRLTPIDRPGPPREEQALLALTLDTDEWRRPTLHAASEALLHSQLQQFHKTLGHWLRCEPIRPRVLKAEGNKLKLSAGVLAGVQRGDEWLIADPNRFPQRLLEQDSAAQQTLLARVDAVGTNESILTVLAGPAASVQNHWRAWPTASVPREVPEPSSRANAKTAPTR